MDVRCRRLGCHSYQQPALPTHLGTRTELCSSGALQCAPFNRSGDEEMIGLLNDRNRHDQTTVTAGSLWQTLTVYPNGMLLELTLFAA
jgi:hypothetical protein